MPYVDDGDLPLTDAVVHEIGIVTGPNDPSVAELRAPTQAGLACDRLRRCPYLGNHQTGGSGMLLGDVGCDIVDVGAGTRGEPQSHTLHFFQRARMSLSLANSPRSAW